MNLDEAVNLVKFAFKHANPRDLFIPKADASTIGDMAKAVQKLFEVTGERIIGTRHGEKLYETLMTEEAYTSSNTKLLDVEGTVEKILTTDYVQEELKKVNS